MKRKPQDDPVLLAMREMIAHIRAHHELYDPACADCLRLGRAIIRRCEEAAQPPKARKPR